MSKTFDLVGEFVRLDRSAVTGFAHDAARPERRFTVEILVDGLQIGSALADHASARAKRLGLGDGCYGFSFVLPETLLARAKMIEARLANIGDAVGAPLHLDGKDPVAQAVAPPSPGAVEWSGGLRFTGWAESADGTPPEICALIDGAVVAQGRAEGWRHVDHPRPAAKCAFDFFLPDHLADGRVWKASFLVGCGVELDGSPVTFVAAPGGVEATLARLSAPPGQRLTAQFFDRLMPGALPFNRYADARADFLPAAPSEKRAGGKTLGVLALDGVGVEATLISLEAQTHRLWACGLLPAGKAGLTFAARHLADFVKNHAGGVDWFLFVAPGVTLNDDALARFAHAADAEPDASLIYADYEIGDAQRPWPVALPAFDYERMLEQGYFAPMFLVPRAVVEQAIRLDAGNLFRLANLALDQAGAGARIVHLPGPAMRMSVRLDSSAGALLAEATADHLRQRRIDATVEPVVSDAAPRCRVRRRGTREKARVSILIPTRNRHDLLKTCIESIGPATTKVKTEIIVVDNDSSDPRTLRYFQQIARDGVAVIRAPGPFNFAHINNLAAARAEGDLLLFLNNDVVAHDADWLEEMVSRLSDETTGVVGAKLLWPSGVIQHGGVTLGVNFGCAHDFRDRMDGDPGYCGALEVARETGAVTAACLLTRKDLFLQLGGFDALRFPVNFNDVDYCLRVRAQGARVVFTPHAVLTHHESVSRGKDGRRDAAGRFRRELWMLRDKWGEALAADPFYNPLLALSDPPYAALSWPPRSLAPRRNRVQPGVQPPPGF